ncbi:quinon protein alcohol dehydrogenase-like superfamily [Mycena rosella]|uniref:Quinon protein alcohol dehydrogenase-like superfamily n=1 Tax=Mycena rosella TaxID=1033263 RepID=A0AAD7FNJ1_MYCRO|nr:quinon protein alcohol dehydrogenase-like superfamily [Mycena rosella]
MVTSQEFFQQWEHSLSDGFQQDGVPATSGSWVFEVTRIPVGSGETRVAALSHDNTLVAVVMGNEIRIYDVATSKLLHTLRGHTGNVGPLEFHPDGRKFASCSFPTRGQIQSSLTRVWDLDAPTGAAATAAASASLLQHWSPEDLQSANLEQQISDSIIAAQTAIDVRTGRAFAGHLSHNRAFSHDGRSLLYLPEHTTLAVLDVANLTERVRLSGHTDSIMWAETSPDDTLVASVSWDKTVRIWSIESGETLQVLEGATNQGWTGAFSPDGQLIAAGEGNKAVRIWRIDTGELLHTLGGFLGWVRHLSFSPDSRCLAAGSSGGTLRVFDTQSGKCDQKWQIDVQKQPLAQAFMEIRHVQYTPRGDLFFSSTEGRSFGYRASRNLKWDMLEPDTHGLNCGTVRTSVDGSRFIAAIGSAVAIWKIED